MGAGITERAAAVPDHSGVMDRRALAFIALLVILDRIVILGIFGFRYTGSDDLTFWQGATDYAQGIFHEPCFYGQNYNIMLEALVAVPLLWCSVPHHIALPVATSVLALFPFFFFAWILYRNGRSLEAAFALLMPIALPVEYGMLTSVSRGFVSGLFFSGLLIIPLLRPRSFRSFVVLSLSCSLGYVFNPNSVIVSLPMVVYVLLHNLRDLRLYMALAGGGALVLFTQFLVRGFYADRPAYNVHAMWDLQYTTRAFVDGFSHLDRYFDHLMPIVWSVGWLILVVILAGGVFLWRSDRKAAIALFVGGAFALAAMGVNKVNDDAETLLHSSVRMYLGLPLLLVSTLCWCRARITLPNWQALAVLSALLFLFVKADVAGVVVREGLLMKEHTPIAIEHHKALEWECAQLGDTLSKYGVDLLVLVPYWDKEVPEMEFLAYGCPLLDERFERTMMNVYERRTWVFEKEQRMVRRNILLYGRPLTLDTLRYYPHLEALRLSREMVLIRNDRYRSRFIMDVVGVELKRNTY